MKQTAKRAMVTPKKVKQTTNPVIYVLIMVLMAVFLVGIYGIGVLYYASRFPVRTTINGIDVSGCKKERARAVINAKVQEYSLTLEERNDVTESITAQKINMTYQDNGELSQFIEGFDSKGWFLNYFHKTELTAELETVYDQKLAEQMVSKLDCFNPSVVVPMENAQLAPASGGGYEVKAEVQGTQLKEEEATKAIFDALDSKAETLNFEELQLYVTPTVYKDDLSLTKQLDDLNLWTSANITYDFEDDRIVTVDQSVIETWLVADENGVYSIDKSLVQDWVRTAMAYKFDTFGLTHIVKTHDGKTVTLKGGDYGWCIDRPNTAEALYNAVLKGEQTQLEPAYLYKANNRGVDDIGGTYVEISIDEQHMWCYQDYKLVVDTPVVTGNPNKEGCATPSGSVWAMDCHKSPATLGTYVTMGYSSYVNFWMSFTGNVGIHDASWRGTDPSNYGGDKYLTNGSHGCVNTPYDAAKKIYEVCRVGTAVIVY